MSSLKKKTLDGLLWSTIERFSIQAVQFVLGIILARLLLPSDYGFIGVLAVFMSISQALIDSGFSQALIQKKNADEKDYNTVFYFNIASSVCIYIVLFLLSEPIAVFYEEPLLENLIKILGLNIIFSSFSIVQLAILTKELNFKTQSKASLISVIISGVIAVYFAYTGMGVWALVIQVLLKSSINTLLLFVFTKWKPILLFSKKSFHSLFSFGSKLLFSGLLNAVFNNIYLIIIGKFYTIKELGYYTRANQFQQLPSETLTVILQRVTFPVLSSIQDEDEKLSSYYKKFIKLAAFINFPLMTLLIVLAKPLVKLLLTDKWIEAAPFLQLLCFVGILYPIHAINLNLLKVKGRSDLFLKLEVYKKVLIIISIVITIPFGIKVLIIGQIACSFISLYLNTYYTKKLIDYGFFAQLKDLFIYFTISVIMGIVMYVSIMYISSSSLKLIVATIVGFFVYSILGFFLKINEIEEIRKIVLLKIKKNK
ncbi:lipopolysaccharide biosynthesis protein [Lacinutrix undariae]